MSSAADPFSDPVPAAETAPPAAPHKPKNILDAVRDVVTVKSEEKGRVKLPRSHTSQPAANGTAPTSRRTVSDESVGKASEKKGKAKKTGAHTDVIDKLDFTGIGAATLHHDGPFDACAPSRNQHKLKAPMMAWSPRDEQEFNVPPVPNDSRISPRAQATMAAMKQAAPGMDSGPYAAAAVGGGGPYPRMTGFQASDWGPAPPRKRHDALAEAWGMHEPEPFEEFMAGGGDHSRPASIRNGAEGKKPATSRDGRELREVYKDYLDERPTHKRRETRTKLPPPAPIALPGTSTAYEEDLTLSASNYSSSKDDGPKRSKSLLNRIKKMKAAPNVPFGATDERSNESSPAAADFGRLSLSDQPNVPSLPHNGSTPDLGKTSKEGEYFDRPASAAGVGAMPQSPGMAGGVALGRKPSLMQKIRGVRSKQP